jgi:protein ImuB
VLFGALHAAVVPPSPETLLGLAREFTPRAEPRGRDTVLLDLRGLARAWPDPVSLGEALLDAGRAFDPQVALAGSRVAACLLARSLPGLTVVPTGAERGRLAPLPLEALELPPELLALLHRWGLRTLGELAALPADGLVARLGAEGPRLRRQARGEDEVPLVAVPRREEFACALELEWPVDGLEPLAFLLARVLEPLCEALRARGRRAVEVALILRLTDGGTHARTVKPAAPSADPRTWRTLLLLDLEARPPRDAIAAFSLRAEPTPARTVQFSLLDPAQPSPERLAETLARLQEWTEAGRGGSPVLIDTHRPGAFAMGSFAPGAWKGPSAPPAARLCLRAFRPPRAARVSLEDGAPCFVSAAGIRGAVTDRAGPWRASGDWWDAAWSREEWDVAVGGGLFRIYRDRLRGGWFVDGELD